MSSKYNKPVIVRWNLRVPPGESDRLHIWMRLDRRPKRFDNRGGVKHDGLNDLIRTMGGKHKDIIIGNYKQGFHAYGLWFKDHTWQGRNNGNGAELLVGRIPYERVQDKATRRTMERQVYIGVVKNTRWTIEAIEALARAEIAGKVYHHRRYNCETFALNLADRLKGR
ncbi:unnamed protein product [Clonostachys rosea]|uniref:PPPDE domain-containing protein n=1 Tax=Bionectria ochroleuca TaxID=29856 RepID=A0ABY6UVL2_BIOOC|nr:unnamed protein product [Clonostachys rosea]